MLEWRCQVSKQNGHPNGWSFVGELKRKTATKHLPHFHHWDYSLDSEWPNKKEMVNSEETTDVRAPNLNSDLYFYFHWPFFLFPKMPCYSKLSSVYLIWNKYGTRYCIIRSIQEFKNTLKQLKFLLQIYEQIT